MTLCRICHRNILDGRWKLVRSPEGISVVNPHNGEQIMRRLQNPGLDVPSLFQLLNMTNDSLCRLQEALPYLTDEQLVEAFSCARSLSASARG